ncbi:MAG: RHS repeat-associated core domain-containing protein [Hyphomonadaceae bacterium]
MWVMPLLLDAAPPGLDKRRSARAHEGEIRRPPSPGARNGGQFLQTDPVGYEDDLNLYAYVGGDPLNASDPSGACRLCRSIFNVVRRTIRNRGDVVRSIRQEAAAVALDVGTLVSPDSSLADRAVAVVNIVSPFSADEIAAGANAVRGAATRGIDGALGINPHGARGGPAHQAGVASQREDSEARASDLTERTGVEHYVPPTGVRVRGHDSRRMPDNQIRRRDSSGDVTVAVGEVDTNPQSRRAVDRRAEYDRLGIPCEQRSCAP